MMSTDAKLGMSLDDLVSNRKSAGGGGGARGGKKRSANAFADGGVQVVGKRCFVGNLAWDTTWQDLKDHFRQCGTVVYADVMKEANNPSRSKGCGIVEFESADQALKAISLLSNSELGGRMIAVREDREDKDLSGITKGGGGGGGAKGGGGGGVIGGGGGGGGKRARMGVSAGTVGRRCYVGNLSWSTSWQDLKDHFRQCGTVVYADVMKEANNPSRSKGCGIVEFESVEQALAAIEQLHDSELDGRPITVREDREDKELIGVVGAAGGGAPRQAAAGRRTGKSLPPGTVGRRCYVGNLSWRTSWQDLKDHFRQCGTVVYADVMKEANNPSRSKGCGIVEFESVEQAVLAIQTLHDSELDGRPITVREDREDKELMG